MHPIFVDIENEFSKIATEAEGLCNRLARLDAEGLLPGLLDRSEATHVCASVREKIYSGCERIMARLASDIDGAPMTRSDGWHMALLPNGSPIRPPSTSNPFGRMLRAAGQAAVIPPSRAQLVWCSAGF
nr:hypothetical protein [uncultured Rhodopila sp.]